MYIFDSDNNSLIQAEPCSFKSLKLKERQHLQEWIAKQPMVLGEDLLIIQKEFDGFSDTNERLDLLALDKDGNLVVIENKLDDSGKNVTWQAIKYASYCSSLTKKEIIEIYSKFLNSSIVNAQQKILDFYGKEDLEELKLNAENSQRIIFVAANFRKEITSSVLWLMNFGINAKCVKVSPYQYKGKVMLEFDQIIPIVDAEDYIIKMAEKKKDETAEAASTKKRHNDRSIFWHKFIEYNQKVNGDYSSSAGTPDSWLGKGGIGINGVSVNVCIAKECCRTEIYINTGEKVHNKEIYDFFFSHKDQLEMYLGKLKWERLDDKITCRISQSKPLSYCKEEDQEKIFLFFVESTKKYITAFNQVAKQYKVK